MKPARVIQIQEEIFAEDRAVAREIRNRMRERRQFLVNIMGSPGAGKTSLILSLIRLLSADLRIGVIEGDVDSSLDADLVMQNGAAAVQIRTGGFCHLNAQMVERGLESFEPEHFDLIFIENIGNLICPADHDTGAFLNMTVLSVPEGDDKPWKYPLVFRKTDVLVISKTDYPDFAHYRLEAVREQVTMLNERIRVFPLSCRTSDGVDALAGYLRSRRKIFLESAGEPAS